MTREKEKNRKKRKKRMTKRWRRVEENRKISFLVST
jgi:hypothetical protein